MGSGIGGTPPPPVCKLNRLDSQHFSHISLLGGNFMQHIIQSRYCDLNNEDQIKDAERELKKWARKYGYRLLED